MYVWPLSLVPALLHTHSPPNRSVSPSILLLIMTSTGVPQGSLDLSVHPSEQNDGPSTSAVTLSSDQSLADDSRAITSPASPLYSVSEAEAMSYYFGLPSKPRLVYRTGSTPWKTPTGFEAYRELKELKPVFRQDIVDVWGELGPLICESLDSAQVTWTTVDVVRFALVGGAPGPPVLWIGVMPKSLSGEDAHAAAARCQDLLKSYKILGVEIEFRESVYSRSAGPKLLESVHSYNVTASVRGPLTPALGLRIAAWATSYAEGTGALYLKEGPDSDRIFVLTARHVVLPPKEVGNQPYDHSNPRRDILILAPDAFQKLLDRTQSEIENQQYLVKLYKKRADHWRKIGDDAALTEVQHDLKKGEMTVKALKDFHEETARDWIDESHRILGHIAYSPPITFNTGDGGYSEDWALIELDRSKIDWDTFRGNVIGLGTKIPATDFAVRMFPDPEARSSFDFPVDDLLLLQGVIGEDELLNPTTLDVDGEPCLMVTKNGATTGLTIGRGTGVRSFVREYDSHGTEQTSMKWTILPYNHMSNAFSDRGDSGAIIVDGKGRIGGLLTGGSGGTDKGSIDVTYATPFYWLLQRIKAHFPHAQLYQHTG